MRTTTKIPRRKNAEQTIDPAARGRLSNPPLRRRSPDDIRSLISAYQSGATINEVAARYDVHRTTVAAHLDRHQVPRHRKQTAWDNEAPGRRPSPT